MSQSSNNIVSRAVIVEKLGNLDEVAKVYDVPLGDLPENKVLVQALVSSVNPVDNLIIAGDFPVPFLPQDFSTIQENSSQIKVNGTIPDGEGIGKVIKIGQNASVAMNGTLEVGDWVVPMDLGAFGTWADYYHADPKALAVIKNKTGLTPESLSSITINLPTAYGLLKDIIPLKAGEYIIQNGANSEVGKYIIQMAHVWGILSSVNPVDNLIIAGVIPAPFVAQDFSTIEQNSSQTKVNGTIPGGEGIGRVVKIGQNASVAMNGTLEVGDWVVPMDLGAFGTWADYYHADPKALAVIKNKTGLTPESLSSITINLPTAYGLLKDIIPLKAGEYIIQNGANSEVGKYIIQMAHVWGIRTVNVIRDRSNYKALENELKSLGADIVIKDTEIKSDETVKLLSSLDAPIKLAINCVGGNSAILLADHLCEGGTYVVYGSITGEDVPVPYSYLISKNISFRGFNIFRYYGKNPTHVWMERWNDIMNLIREGKIQKTSTHLVKWESYGEGSLETLQKKVQDAITSTSKVSFVFN
ncbi:hypothetical protein BB558_002040 [Smittium angustum]|uniref:Alcohol dehydrogenase-like C-terminal domain-containing protein n=1 Tax=Smittium angustum TaxID=133377 RepID=A0A2U1J9R6_SMIAN|nr:hypothetical protein BB558_002040 [Smittium angustum]